MSRNSPAFALSRAVFIRGLGFIYAVAFLSLAVQVRGLIGDSGILPVRPYLANAHAALGGRAYRLLPTLLWIGNGDAVLIALTSIGAILAITLLLTGRAPRPLLACLWLLYLSFTVGGQVFLQFQWDALLLEAGLIGVVYAPAGLKPDWRGQPDGLTRWLTWWLCFRLMFLSGITKLLSGDPTWRNLSALDFHYWTQPLPNPIAWWADRVPSVIGEISVAVMFAIEIGLPFLILAPTRFLAPRRAACVGLVALQVGIALTGNYGFFNLLAIVLCIALLDDGSIRAVLPRRWRASPAGSEPLPIVRAGASARQMAKAGVVGIMIALGGLALAREIAATTGRAMPRIADAVLGAVAPLSSFNGYGLFRVMTTDRPEIVIETSDDGTTWSELPFRYKPGDPMRAPPFVAPHMPRLDWQMWFAALDPQRATAWLLPMLAGILEDSGPVVRLLENDGEPPRYVRLAMYRYAFASPAGHNTGAWWTREFVGYLTPPLTRDDLSR